MSDKSKAKTYQRVINKLMVEICADRQGEPVIMSSVMGCIKLLNNTLPPEWRWKAPTGVTSVDGIKEGNA